MRLARHTFKAAHQKFTAAISPDVPSSHPHLSAVPTGAFHRVLKACAAVLDREIPPSIWTDLNRPAASEQQDNYESKHGSS